MAGHRLLKRKGVDEISHDFSDFSLSSPATKIRRLDSASLLPPIVEEDDQPPSFTNDERALVLFKPLHHHSPSSYSLTVDSELLSEIKNQQLPWWTREEERDLKSNNHHLAIVPWVPQSSSFSTLDEDNTNVELMEADDVMGEQEEGEGVMDIEEEQQDTAVGNAPSTSITNFPTTMNLPEGFQQQQQHCFLPHLPQSNSTPITWTR
ncbi:uncharacterized protein LOC130715377 [Lotus japonicus]|uniref:uncharacterized protein LOC130715377 n=1 Tax=Lotus japonicus TaxID=34305 RepID=UPI002589A457|nr:uncharacterized protein LOC130715377 [Lotus japonicus]